MACLFALCSTVTRAAQVSEAWARATVPGQTVGAVYLTITNPITAKLIAAKTPAAKRVEIHSSRMEDGIMQMRELKALDLPAGERVTLSPMGTHLMLMDLKSPLKEGDSVALELIIVEKKKRRSVQIDVPVKALTH